MKIYANNLPLLEGQERTYLSAAATAADGTLTVRNGLGFGLSKYVLVGNFGDENAEIIQTHASTASTGTTITLLATTTLAKNHSIDDPVTLLDYNQVEFSRATTSGGSKSTLTTISIDPDTKETIYDDTTNSTGYAYVRFKNSTTTTYSDYSDEIPYEGFGTNTVFAIKKSALKMNNYKLEQGSDAEITESDLLDWINECQEEVWNRQHRLSCFEEYDSSTTTVSGTDNYAVVTGFTPISGMIRYNTEREPIIYLSRQKFLQAASVACSGTPLYYTVWDNLIYLWPNPNDAKTLHIWFFKKPGTLNSDSDTVVVWQTVVRYYVAMKITEIRLDEKRLAIFERRYTTSLENMITEDETMMLEEAGQVEIEDRFEHYEDEFVF